MPYADSNTIGTVGAAFTSTALVYNLSTDDNGVLKVLVYRGNSKAAATVPVTITAVTTNASIFTLPSANIQFAAGENSTYLSVSYPMASIAPAKKYTFKLTMVGDDLISPTKRSIITVNAQLPLIYPESLSFTGRYVSNFYETDASVKVYKAQLPASLPAFYRIIEPYEPGSGYNIEFNVDNGAIVIAAQNIGWKYSDAYGYCWLQPQSTSIVGKTYTWNCKFNLPTAGMGFTGTFDESLTLP